MEADETKNNTGKGITILNEAVLEPCWHGHKEKVVILIKKGADDLNGGSLIVS